MEKKTNLFINPNLNGFVLFLCCLFFLIFFILTMVGNNVYHYDIFTGDSQSESSNVTIYVLYSLVFLISAAVLYAISMFIGTKLPVKKISSAWPIINITILLLLAVPIEWYCARLAYHTVSEIESAVYFMAIGLNLPFLILALRWPKMGTIMVFLLAVGMIPYQLYLGQRLIDLQAESARIVAYAYEQKLVTGKYPSDLSGYTFSNPATQKFLQDYTYNDMDDSFSIFYSVGTPSTSHWYNPKQGWCYYPD